MFSKIWYFPSINPVALDLGPVQIHWYAVAYVLGILSIFALTAYMVKREKVRFTTQQLDNFFPWAVMGVVVGGRLGYVIFYQPDFYFSHLVQILALYNGGMSFHGGALGCILAAYIYCRRHRLDFIRFTDVFSISVPLTLFFGRIANFINGELWGRVTDGTWGIIFPQAGNAPRHPSQLYEAFFEGIFLLTVMYMLALRFNGLKPRGLCSGVFLMGYGIIRIIVEGYREPDPFIGTFAYGTTLGQWLSVPMVFVGAILVRYASKRR